MTNSFMNIVCEDEEKDEKKKNDSPDPLAEKFLKTRQILLSGEINEENAEKIIRQILMKQIVINQYTFTLILLVEMLMPVLQFLMQSVL